MRKFPLNDLLSSRLDLRTQDGVKQLETPPKNAGNAY